MLIIVIALITRSLIINRKNNALIKQNLNDKESLLKEIHHRVKNNLQFISSLLSIQSRFIKDEKALEAINESKERLLSISLLHQELYQNEVLQLIDANLYLQKLCNAIKQTFDQSKNIQLIFKSNANVILMDVEQLMPLGLIANELITNSYKYGCTNIAPVINVELFKNSDEVNFEVADNGVGFNNEIDFKKSLGFKLINLFCQKIKASMAFAILTNKDLIGKPIEYIRESFGSPDGFYFIDSYPAYLIQEGKNHKEATWQIVFKLNDKYNVREIIVHKNCCE